MPTPWNMNDGCGAANLCSPARYTTLPIEFTLPTLCVVSVNGIPVNVLYNASPCITLPPGVERSRYTSETPLFAKFDITAISASVVCGVISAENETYASGGAGWA